MLSLALQRVLSTSVDLRSAAQVFSVVFKALNTLVVRLDALVARSSSRRALCSALRLLSDLSDCLYSLFRLVVHVLLSETRFGEAREAFERVSAARFSEHHSPAHVHPLRRLSAFAIEAFLEPRVFSLLTRCFFRVSWALNRGQATSSAVLKLLLDCKFGMRAFCALFLSFFPDRRSEFVSDFVSFAETRHSRVLGLAFVNEALRSAAYIVKGLRVQLYIRAYHSIKDESVELASSLTSESRAARRSVLRGLLLRA